MPQIDKPLVGRPTGRKSTAGRETFITPEAEEAAKTRSSGLIKEYAVGGDIVASEDPEANIVENADKSPVSPSQFARGVGTTALQTAKGVATGAVGFAGDVISIAQGAKEVLARTDDQDAASAFVKGMEQKTGLPTTEDVNSFIDQWLPDSLQSGSMAQDVGEMSSPGGAAKSLAKGVRKGAPLLAKEAARQTENVMRKQGLMPSIVPEGETLVKRSPYDAVGLTDDGVEEWRNAHRVQNRQEPIAEVKNAAIKLRDGEISSAEYREVVKQYQPIIPLTEVPRVPTLKELVAALNKDKVETGVVGINKTFKDGDKVASRLDIPAYDNYDTWVVSLHDGTKTGGKSLGYAQTAVLKNVDFRTAPSGALKIATKDKAKETIARIHGDWVNEDPMIVAKRAEEAIKSPEWKQIGMNPYRHSYFYDKADGMPVVEADEIIQVGPLVLAKKPKYASPDDPQFRIRKNDETSPTFAIGGVVEEKQNKYAKGGTMKQMNKLFAEGGMMDNSGEVVNGVEVPPGSLRNEVADDVPAKLSEGEFVVPADVVRFIGLEKLMKMRDAAKAGLARMQEVGQMGNAQEVANPDQQFNEEDTSQFEGDIDNIIGEIDQTPAFAFGGFMSSDLSKAPKNSMIDVGYYKNKEDGRVLWIVKLNGKPTNPVPDGFVEVDAAEARNVGIKSDEAAAVAVNKDETTTSKDNGSFNDMYGDALSSATGDKGSSNKEGVDRNIEIDPLTGKAKSVAIPDWAKAASAIVPGGALAALAYKAGSALNAADWNKALESGNVIQTNTAADGSKTPSWIDTRGVSDTGYGVTSKGTSISTDNTIRAQDESVFGGYMDSSGNFVETKPTVAAQSKPTPTPTPTTAPARNIVYDGEGGVYSIDGAVQNRGGRGGGGVTRDWSDTGTYSGGGSYESAGGVFAKGGIVTRRTPKKKQDKKGLASKK